ncbi:hypothetical protein CTAYLR_010203 [Chrysophaeum taylorii]|uniref:Sugar phosphate transporter domain-containing protein n=1 Tax=Chrysophaeum taylorii TaxID=2483200 RepID=A0AAD7UCS8_9STRA|nr:hypothetical protein CTAYLR_010203 [Chrysophaeum taylorii]
MSLGVRMDDASSSKEDIPRLLAQKHGSKGQLGTVLFYIGSWYLASLGCLLLNKTILSDLGASSAQLGLCQMVATASFGGLKMLSLNSQSDAKPSATSVKVNRSREATVRTRQLRLTLLALATLRMASVILGLVSLKHVPASFTETVKSTAPLFTVYLQHLVLGMKTTPQVLASLVPVMAGLVVCAHAEVQFDAIGFWAAVGNNVIDCLQNVLSKKTLEMLTPIHLQFYTSVLALVFQIPILVVRDVRLGLVLDPQVWNPRVVWNPLLLVGSARNVIAAATSSMLVSRRTLVYYAADLVCYHAQSIAAYFVVASLTPVSVSVANTLKRSLLIALSVAYFGNQMTLASVLGVLIVIAGVCLYNAARARFPAPDDHPPHRRDALANNNNNDDDDDDDDGHVRHGGPRRDSACTVRLQRVMSMPSYA